MLLPVLLCSHELATKITTCGKDREKATFASMYQIEHSFKLAKAAGHRSIDCEP
jgi:hypothetical protein